MKRLSAAALIFSGLIVAGCAGGNVIDEAVPQAAFGDVGPDQQQANGQGAVQPGADPFGQAAAGTNAEAAAYSGSQPPAGDGRSYPNINSEPSPSLMQMSDEQRAALLSEMQALADAHARGVVSSAEYNRRLAELRRLAATHSDEAIKIIED